VVQDDPSLVGGREKEHLDGKLGAVARSSERELRFLGLERASSTAGATLPISRATRRAVQQLRKLAQPR